MTTELLFVSLMATLPKLAFEPVSPFWFERDEYTSWNMLQWSL